jgi:membrane-bound lytic murein transglycosylase B
LREPGGPAGATALRLAPALRCGRVRPWLASLAAGLLALPAATPAAADQVPQALLESVQRRLIADGFDTTYVRQLFAREQVRFETRGIGQYFRHTESRVDYGSMASPALIQQGRRYLRAHAPELAAAQTTYGVGPEVIAAIILVETRFGRFLGDKAVINTLSTMASLAEPGPRDYLWSQLAVQGRYDRPAFERKADAKSSWAYAELKAFLTYAQSCQLDPASVLGSYAGALGIAQFIPSSILAFGRDGDGNGRIDLFTDADAIHSIASYLQHFGWKAGLTRAEARAAVYQYNHSEYYVAAVLRIADLLRG